MLVKPTSFGPTVKQESITFLGDINLIHKLTYINLDHHTCPAVTVSTQGYSESCKTKSTNSEMRFQMVKMSDEIN